MLTPTDLQAFLDSHAIRAEILHLDAPTPTVETAARAVGAQPDQIVKSVLFLVRGEPVLAVACGTARIDRRKLAAHYRVGRKRVKLAAADAVLRITGYPAGAVPPFGHPQPIPTLLDPGVLVHEQVYAGGGAGNALVRLHPADILRVTAAQVLDLLARPSPSPASQPALAGKTALVTGAGRGVGRAIAEALAAQGVAVAANDINPDNLTQTVQHITQKGGRAREYLADVSKKFPLQAMLNQIEDDGSTIDLLVHTARVTPRRALLKMDEWEWRRTLEVNLTAAFLLTQVAGRVMRSRESGGLILHLVQTSTQPNYAAYRAAAAGVLALARAAAQELVPDGIHVAALVYQRESQAVIEKTLSLCASQTPPPSPVIFLDAQPDAPDHC